MAYYTIEEARAAFRRSQTGQKAGKSATASLNEDFASVRDADAFDIFLSHAVADADAIAGVKVLLEEQGNKVYVDWIVDRQLDRKSVTPTTADLLRRRLRQSKSMIFATSSNSPNSKWMPWELGYFDGLHGSRIAVLPLVQSEGASFEGQEYLGLYPLVERLPTTNGKNLPYVTRGQGTRTYIELGAFRSGATAFKTY